jgi:hypothetical protein
MSSSLRRILVPPCESLRRFLDQNADYDANPKSISDLIYDEYDDLEVDSYVRMLHHRADSPSDDRVSAIEIQVQAPVDISGRILAAILPKPYFDRPGIQAQVESWNAVPIPYHVKEEFRPREAHAAISERLTIFLEKNKVLEV